MKNNSLPGGWENFNSVLQWRGREQPDRTAFVYLTDGEVESRRLTFAELDHMAGAVAAWIKAQGLVGERILLLYPPGLDFIIGLLGCLYAGAIAVPAYPPHPRRSDPRLEAIFDDCQPRAAFCIETDIEQLKQQLAERKLQILATDSLASSSERWHSKQIKADSIAYLQYTSGSTGAPKGVVVTQGNLLYQADCLADLSLYDEQTVHVNWQPFFHDMGLVGSIIFPIFVGAISYIMAPAAFLRKPIRWLEAMSRYKGTGAPGPNFAFEICVTQTTPEEREGLDLSSWKVAWNGAEPIRPETLKRFSETYEPYGFNSRAHLPCYGMAETVLGTAACRPDRPQIISSFQRDELEQNHALPCPEDDPSAVQLVSSGRVFKGMEIAIVEPDTLSQCEDGHVGEIWVSGNSVAHGYWNKPKETEETFNAHIADSNKGPFLRTGDLGFMLDGELFVTGRLKDMIIIRGRNVYPQDIELVAQKSHQALQTDACAAFSIEEDGQEEIALAIEVKRTERRRSDFSDIFEAIRSAVSDNFGVSIHWLGIIQPGRIPKTSSGKIMRRACRRDYLSNDLALVTEWRAARHEQQGEHKDAAPIAGMSLVSLLRTVLPSQRHQVLVSHIQSEIARMLDLQHLPDPQSGFERLGIDSMEAVKLVNRLQEQMEDSVELPTTLLFDQPNIDAVSRYLDQALFEREEDSVTVAGTQQIYQGEPVAIVGLACRFPGADDVEQFWQLLDEGQDAIREVPENRWDIDYYFDQDIGVPGKMNTRFGGFINEIDGFDAGFFGISPREAASMDPQHRHLLEVSWLALENAGIAPSTLDGRPVGVFIGISTSDYDQILSAQGVERSDAFSATGNAHSAAAGRLSFLLGLQGPCLAVDTACSSSLVAVHQAVQSLRLRECETALVGGVNTVLRPDITVAFSKAQLLAPDGRCKTFDASADGYVRSEGCGVVVLKRLSDARHDGDHILAVIRGSAVNQDGRSSGLTAPSGPSQTQVIANALNNAGIKPADVSYLECHGTGTVLGDPIEVQAANAIYSQGRDDSNPLLIGSVKSNIGHLEAAAGIAGLIKVVLALEHAKIPPSLHFQTPNPHIPWDTLNVQVAAKPSQWKQESGARLAGISSFGFAGTNAHVVLEQAPSGEQNEGAPRSVPSLLAISARTEKALRELAGQYARWLKTNDEPFLEDFCHTVNIGRDHLECRAVLLSSSRETTIEQLEALAKGREMPGTETGTAPQEVPRRVAFVFPGEGLQYSGMASELYEDEPVFRECLDRCAQVYDEQAKNEGSPLLKELMFHPDGMGQSEQTRHIRPALYSLQVSLAALWRSWGVKPDAVFGHSAGEYAAACVAGVFSVEDGLRLVMERARLLESLPGGGGMMSVTAPADIVDAAIKDDDTLNVSAYNGLNIVVSGPEEQLKALIDRFEKEGRYCTRLPATNAAHCIYVEPILDEFEAFAQGITFSAPATPFISGLIGDVTKHGIVPDAEYWRKQTRMPVRFAQGVQSLFENIGCDAVIELGPQAELIWLAQMSYRPEHTVLWASSLEKGHNALEQMLSTAAKLHANGTNLNFDTIGERGRRHQRLTLPGYPFQHEHYWAAPMGQLTSSKLQDLMYRVVWRPGDLLSPSGPMPGQSWLIISEEAELAAAMVMELEARGQQSVVTVQLNSCGATAKDIKTALEQVLINTPVENAVFIAGPISGSSIDIGAIEVAQRSGVERALLISQALASMRGKIKLWFVTRGVQAILDKEVIDPAHSTLWGFARSFALERPDRFAGLIDLELGHNKPVTAEVLVSALLSSDGEYQVAIRNGQRWFARLDRSDLPESFGEKIEPEATYLITGGTGALGLVLARHLAKHGARKIILSSRSGGGEAAKKAISELADTGCEARIVKADIADAGEAERIIQEINTTAEEWPLRGIIHAAGIVEGAPAMELSTESLNRVLAPKVLGAWNLHRLTSDLELDFFVMFSSSASLFGLAEHSNYSAANAFLDSLAQYRRSLGLSAISINWGPWANDGMATRMKSGQDVGSISMSPKKTMLAFEHLMGTQLSQICVHLMDWNKVSDLATGGRLPPILLKFLELLITLRKPEDILSSSLRQPDAVGEVAPLVKRLESQSQAEHGYTLQNYVKQSVSEVLGLSEEKIDLEAGFFDLGMNSIMAVELINKLRQELGDIPISPQLLYENPSVSNMARALAGELKIEGVPAVNEQCLPGITSEIEKVTISDHTYVYRRFHEGDKESVIDSFSKGFGDEMAINLASTFDWKYLNSPQSPSGGPLLDILECDHEIVGTHGGVCVRFKINEQTMPGVWSVDTQVNPDYRQASNWFLGSAEIYRNLEAGNQPVRLGMPRPESYTYSLKTGSFIDIDQYTILKAPIDLRGILRARGVNALVAGLSGLLFWPVSKAMQLRSSISKQRDVNVSVLNKFDDRFDSFWQSVADGYPGIMVRDYEFLSWRFDQCPNRHYSRYVAERDGKIVGYMITRSRFTEGARRGKIVDFLVKRDDLSVLGSLIQEVIRDFKAQGIVSAYCSISSSQSQYIQLFRLHGFISKKPGNQIVAARVPQDQGLSKVDDWFITHADGDIDYCELEE